MLYHVAGGPALKFSSKPAGTLLYHNTMIAEDLNRDPYSNAHFRNNLFLGTDSAGRGIVSFPNTTSYSTYDYDGFRPNRNAADQYLWFSPAKGELRDFSFTAQNRRSFKTIAEFAEGTGQETHGIEVDYDIFENLRPPKPNKPHAVYRTAGLNFRLRPGSKAVDAGVRLPNINDNFTGKAPDLGALELRKPEPVYGPRTAFPQPVYR